MHIILTFLSDSIVPFRKCLIVAETFPVLAVQFLHLGLFLFLAAGEILYFVDDRFELETGTHHLGAAVLFYLGHFPE